MNWDLLIKTGIEIVAVTIAIWIADGIRDWYKKRNSPPDLGCDFCECIKNLYHTPDRRWWYCRKCMESYLKEGGFTEVEKQAVRSKYKVKPIRKLKTRKKKT